MTEMTSRERVLKLFAREPVDTMPCFSGKGMVTVPAIEALGIRFPQIHLSAENMAGSAVKSMEMFDFTSSFRECVFMVHTDGLCSTIVHQFDDKIR